MYDSLFQVLKRISWTGIITLFITVVILFSTKNIFSAATLQQDSEALINLLRDSNITVKKAVFKQSGMVKEHQSEEDFLIMMGEIEEAFGLNMISITDENRMNLLRFQGERKLSSDTKLKVAWIGELEGIKSSTYTTHIVVEISSNELDLWRDYYSYLTNLINELGIAPQIKTSFQGIIDQMMTTDEQVDFIANMFSKLEGQVTEGLTSDSVVSHSGYSKKMNHTLNGPNGKINFQIAARTSHLKKGTFITIGNPVIIMEY
jgi:hypothetical protein